MLGLMQQPPASHIGPRRLRLDLARRTRDRLPRPGRGDPPLDLRRSRRARQASRECARRARGGTRGPRRDARLERLAPSRNLLWRDQLGTRSAHGQSAALSRPDPIHHASRGRRVCVLRPGFCAAHRGARPAPAACARLGRALRGRPASQDEARRASRLRGSPGEGFARLRMAAPRREHGLDALLHLRHDRQSEGRDVLAIARRCCTPSPPARPTHSASWRAIRSSSWCRSSTPTPGACRFPRRCAERSSCSPVRGSIPKASTCCSRARDAPRPSAFRRSGSTSSPGWKRTKRSSTFPG